MARLSFLIVVVVLAIFSPRVQLAAHFDPRLLRVVAKISDRALLVRGNAPLNGAGQFDPKALTESSQVLTNLGSDPTLSVVSLVSSSMSDERAVLEAENHVHWLPVLNEMVWDLLRPDGGAWELVSELQERLLKCDVHERCLVYVHCMRGKDRTGVVAGAYAIRYQGASFVDVQKANTEIAGRELDWASQRALSWVEWRADRAEEVSAA